MRIQITEHWKCPILQLVNQCEGLSVTTPTPPIRKRAPMRLCALVYKYVALDRIFLVSVPRSSSLKSLVAVLLLFWERDSCSLGWPQACFIIAGDDLDSLSVSASWVLALQVYATITDLGGAGRLIPPYTGQLCSFPRWLSVHWWGK